jgi:hypothetical protein
MGAGSPGGTTAKAEPSPRLIEVPTPGRILGVRYEDPATCNPGVLDLIGLEIEEFAHKARSAAVIFSIEPLADGVGITSLFMSSESRQMPPQEFQVPLGSFSSPTLAGVYLCLDSSGDGRCGAQPYQGFNDMMRRYQVERDEAGNPTKSAVLKSQEALPEDKIYLFSPILIDRRSISIMPAPLPGRLPNNLRKLLSEEAWKSVVARRDVISPPPLRVEGERLVVDLPHFSPDACHRVSQGTHDEHTEHGHAH